MRLVAVVLLTDSPAFPLAFERDQSDDALQHSKRYMVLVQRIEAHREDRGEFGGMRPPHQEGALLYHFASSAMGDRAYHYGSL